jgi:23S rRNA (guanosine2251-2'-O)-methyltransferase
VFKIKTYSYKLPISHANKGFLMKTTQKKFQGDKNTSKPRKEKTAPKKHSRSDLEKNKSFEKKPNSDKRKPPFKKSSRIDSEKPPFKKSSRIDSEKPPFKKSSRIDSEKPPFRKSSRIDSEKPPFRKSSRIDSEKPPFRKSLKPEADKYPQRREGLRTNAEKFSIWGKRPVESLLQDLASQNEGSFDASKMSIHFIHDKQKKIPAQLKNCVELSQALGIKIHLHESQEIETWPLSREDGLNHQRVCLVIPKFPMKDLQDAIIECRNAKENNIKGCVGLVLDQIQDPRNFGSIVRTAAFFGVKFVIFGTDRQADLTPLVVKTSAGGAFQLGLISTPNLNRALNLMKEAGAWIVGTEIDSKQSYSTLSIDRPFVLVVSNEAKGMRQEIKKNCDFSVSIAGGNSTLDSLNVGVATGVVLSKMFENITPCQDESLEPVNEIEEMMDRR